jgi:hypothetical protein
MYLMSRLLNPRILALLAPLALSLLPRPTMAQTMTWVGNRQGPALTEILTIDATGETNWPYGREDVAGDGLNNFTLPEQAIDARTVYVATDANRFYSRVYFSIPAAEPGSVTTFVFIDSDQNAATGGSASAAELDPTFPANSAVGGYEYAIKVQRTANNTTAGSIWRYDIGTLTFAQIATQAPQIITETNFALDPIRVGQDIHGYIQSSVELAQVGLAQACQASILVRTTNQTASLGVGDLDVGAAASCVQPAAPNPVVVVPPPGCTINAECPNGGICVNGNCILAPACATDANCAAGYICDVGRCVFVGGTPCVNSSNCDGLICQQGECVVCVNDASCGPGFVCAPDGRCLAAGTGPIPCVNSGTCFGLLCQQGLCVGCPDNAACGPGFLCADGRCYAGVGAPCTNADTCNGLLCQQGRCVVCVDNAACGPGFVCDIPGGRCVAGLGTACTNSSTCNGFVCEGGQCVACANDAACGAGLTCGADGRCVVATTTTTTTPSDAGVMYVAPGERLQGGACACRAVTGSRKGMLVLLSLLGTALLLGRHSKREREQ